MAVIDRYIEALKKQNAQALTLKSGSPVEMMVNGASKAVSSNPVTAGQIMNILGEILPAGFQAQVEGNPKDFSHTSPFGAVKITVLTRGGQVSARIMPANADAASEEESDDDLPSTPQTPEAPVQAPPNAAPQIVAAVEGGQMDKMFHQMLDLGASDLHLKSGKQPMVRLHGDMKVLEGWPAMSSDELYAILRPLMPERNRLEFEQTNDTDFSCQVGKRARMRSNLFRDIVGVGAVFRQIPTKILTVKDLNIPEAAIRFCDHSKGLILVTGPTGSGKSTTLASLIDYVNTNRNAHIITIEDPVEFVHPDKQCLINQREVGTSTQSFKRALRAALREDPDIVLLGELRDLETTEIAIETAETGHLVFGTLHTNTAPSTVDRIIDQFPTDRQSQVRAMLSESLIGVISQTLCKKIGGGRIAILEILVVNSAVSNLIREGKTFQIPSIMQTARNVGMQTMNDVLIDFVKQKLVAPEEAYLKSLDKKAFIDGMTKAGIKFKPPQG